MTGVKAANPKLTVFGFSGDGDSYSEGISHLIQAVRRNSDINLFAGSVRGIMPIERNMNFNLYPDCEISMTSDA